MKLGQYSILNCFQNFCCIDSGLFHLGMLSVLLIRHKFKKSFLGAPPLHNPFHILYQWEQAGKVLIYSVNVSVLNKNSQCGFTSPFGEGKGYVSLGLTVRGMIDRGLTQGLNIRWAGMGPFLFIFFWLEKTGFSWSSFFLFLLEFLGWDCSNILSSLYITGFDKLWIMGQMWPPI